MLLARRGARSRRRAAKPASAGARRCARPVAASPQGRQRSAIPALPAGAPQAMAAAEAGGEARAPPARRDASAVLVAVLRFVCDALLSARACGSPRHRSVPWTEPGRGRFLRARGLVSRLARRRAGARRLPKSDRALRGTRAGAGGADFAPSPLTSTLLGTNTLPMG